ncbi:HNH endonuclease [Actinomadura sp. 6K520]|uniref:HNH endonuclease n=1 Tax=Actinomadura sp. 6K520 TaxID=2530364 RepID=UPI001042982C|nr:HNH endonuclease [Actinomadura sp. 6K520]TDE33472.1 HNH endonuclease [Actinomadura sp. 6K520]
MKVYVGVTDGEWSRFLAERPEINEVNFWRPSSANAFRVLSPGEPFFFKSHYPENRIVGGGVYSGFARLRASEAWALYGEGNGASSLELMRARINHYRREGISPREDPVIGCVLLRDVRFFSVHQRMRPPVDFASNIVQGKSYDLGSVADIYYFQGLISQLLGQEVNVDDSRTWHRPGAVYGDRRLTPQRLGQTAFKAVVLTAYEGHCAITGSKIRPVLQAAHVKPLPAGGEHRLDNGILLRSDVHTLFDRGYLGLDSKHRLLVSSRLRDEFGNGEQYYRQAGKQIRLPDRRADRPNAKFLEWHADVVFRG